MNADEVITPCSNAGKHEACKSCVRNNSTLKERMERVNFYSAPWEPDADGVCLGFVEAYL